MSRIAALVSFLAVAVVAQQPGEYTPEVHPTLPSWRCTVADGCTPVSTKFVLDSNYRWTHSKGGYDACYDGGFDATLCPDAETCGASCVLEGVDYPGYGITFNDDAVTLNLYVKEGNVSRLSSPRGYLLDEDGETYDMFKLLGKEIAFDVDTSKVPCGVNGALYLSEMNAKGGESEINPAGAAFGTGYCDAQCPVQNFLNGTANLDSRGACCPEMDLWEANSAATAFTPHPCSVESIYACAGVDCGNGDDRYNGVCDKDGCDYNHYRLGSPDYYGPGKTVDTTKKFTVVTQFLTNTQNVTNTTSGQLVEIRRLYVQNGVVIQNSKVAAADFPADDSMTDAFCATEKEVFGGPNDFYDQGALAGMGRALDRGMVLAFSIWDDSGSHMLWLDGTYPTDANPETDPGTARGPCSADSGVPADNLANYPDAAVTWSNIRSGEIGSTFATGNSRVIRKNLRRY